MSFNEQTKRYDTPCTYTVVEKSNLNNRMYEAGETVEYDGMPAENLKPVDDEGESRYKDYLASNAARVAAMKEQFADSNVGDADKFAKAFAVELAKVKSEADEKIAAMGEQFTNAIRELTAALAPKPAAPAEHSDMA